jgi:hypothetical protein
MRYIQAYRQLEKIGFIGAEQRLNWIESLREANAQAGLFGVDYQMTAQEPFPYVTKDNPIGSRIKQSKMRLTFGVLHEADLMKLFRSLSARQAGLFSIVGCSWTAPGGTEFPFQASQSVGPMRLSWVDHGPQG